MQRKIMESIHKHHLNWDYTQIKAFFTIFLVYLNYRKIFTVGCKIINYCFFILFFLVGIGSFLEEHIHNFEAKFLILMHSSGKYWSLEIFLWWVYYFFGIGIRKDFSYLSDIPEIIVKNYLNLMAFLSSNIRSKSLNFGFCLYNMGQL